MGLLAGIIRYLINVPTTVWGFISMYIFGGGLITLFNTWDHLFSGDFLGAFWEYFINSALPPTSIEQVLFQMLVGLSVASFKWFLAMGARGVPL